jgi:TPR repeat protein
VRSTLACLFFFLLISHARAETPQENFDTARLLYTSGGAAMETNEKKALAAFQQLAGKGHLGAKFYLGEIFETGRAGKTIDMKVAERHYRAAALGCYEHALHVLRTSFLVPEKDMPSLPALEALAQAKISSNYKGIFDSFLSQAKKGDLCAMRAVGHAVIMGLERMRNSVEGWKPDAQQQKQGMDFLKAGAEAGMPWAQNSWALALDQGLGGVTVNLTEAKKWRQRAAAAGFAVTK